MNQPKYFETRINQLRLSEEQNSIEVILPGAQEPKKMQLLSDDGSRAHNLSILYLSLHKKDGHYLPLTYEGQVYNEYLQQQVKQTLIYQSVRLAKPKGEKKYDNPSGVEAKPYLTLPVIDAFNAKLPIQSLIILEGQLKALKGSINGLYCIGLNGIWGMRGKQSKELHPLIKQVIETCQVQNIIYMHDSDCRQISNYDAYKDLIKRPKNFSDSVTAFRNACKYYNQLKGTNLKAYYAHIAEGQPKGLDDLFCSLNGSSASAASELLSFQGKDYFCIYPILEWDNARIKEYFYIDDVKKFYDKHADILEDKPFLFDNDYWQYDDENEEQPLQNILPGVVQDFALVGSKYYHEYYDERRIKEHVFYELNRTCISKEIIVDEFKRRKIKEVEEMTLRIPKYAAFKNEPDFLDHKRDFTVNVHSRTSKFLNLAYPLEHTPQEGEWPHIKNFLTHIFTSGGEDKLSVALDMIQMYYLMPKQKQRVMALVSKANETGKSTFLILMRYIFGQNMAIIRNADLESQFNGYVVKSLGGVDESKITDLRYVEMLKSLITMPFVNFNDKNVSAKEIETHFKLIMTTNHVYDFISIAEEENKWFVVEVGTIAKKDNSLVNRMVEEIPAFLYFLQHRQLQHYTKESRFAIPDKEVETEALRRIKENSKPELVTLITKYFKSRFLEFNEPQIKISAKMLYQELFPDNNSRFTNNEISKCLKNDFGLEVSETPKYFRTPFYEIIKHEGIDETTGEYIEPVLKKDWHGETGNIYTIGRENFISK